MKSNLSCYFWLIYFGLSYHTTIYAQAYLSVDKRFERSLEEFGLHYYEPTEAWLHPVPLQSDDYGPFNLILQSSDDKIEIRYRFKKIKSLQDLANHPQLDMFQYVSTLSSNTQNRNITLTEIEPKILDSVFHADWGLYADFQPKESVAKYPRCRLIGLYKEGCALVYSMVFYIEELPEYFKLPISFKEESIQY